MHTLDTMASTDPHSYLKLEDIHSSSLSPPESSYDDEPQREIINVQSKPAKKRKSWGQELPEPKTTLPPRKRAKTDDEKEQRRIERIKRNRAAAHNSRERKRQETDRLAVALARANAEIAAYRRLHGPLPADVTLPEVNLITEDVSTPAPSLMESRGSVDTTASPASPDESIFDSPPTTIKEEPVEMNFPAHYPPAFHSPPSKSAPLSLLDPTQHSAAMLCDLQCRSSECSRLNHNTGIHTPASLTSTTWWATLFLNLISLQLQTTYKAILLALWSTAPSRMERTMQASMTRLTSRSTTSSTTPLLLSWSTAALAQRNAATRPQVLTTQGAPTALQQRRRLIEARRTERIQADAAEQLHSQSITNTKAFEESGGREFGNDDGDGGVEG